MDGWQTVLTTQPFVTCYVHTFMLIHVYCQICFFILATTEIYPIKTNEESLTEQEPQSHSRAHISQHIH